MLFFVKEHRTGKNLKETKTQDKAEKGKKTREKKGVEPVISLILRSLHTQRINRLVYESPQTPAMVRRTGKPEKLRRSSFAGITHGKENVQRGRWTPTARRCRAGGSPPKPLAGKCCGTKKQRDRSEVRDGGP